MEFWNKKNLHEPPTYTYKSIPGEVDIDHMQKVLQDGIDFFNEQNLMNEELALLTRVIYIKKTKLRNSKDFKILEKVKRDLMRFTYIDISNKLEHLSSILPLNQKDQEIFLPTKNMLDFILVRLQGIGKVLCRTMELCKLSAEFNECRLRLGHIWNLALLSLGIVSRIYTLSLHILKFTCILYVRLLPFSHKLRNPVVDWLPNNYTFPKDLKEWLNIDWDKLTEVIEIKDSSFDKTFFDLCNDSDDDIQFCDEYVEVDEDEVEIFESLKQLSKKRTKTINLENSVIILRGFATDCVDTGEVILSSDENDGDELKPTNSLEGNRLEKDVAEVISATNENASVKELSSKETTKIPSSEPHNTEKKLSARVIDIEENNSSSNENIPHNNTESSILHIEDENETEEASSFRTVDIAENSLQVEDVGEVISSSDEDVSLITLDSAKKISGKITPRKTMGHEPISLNESALLISSDEESVVESENIVGSIGKLTCPRQKPSLITCDFMPLKTNSSKDFSTQNDSEFPVGISQQFNRNNNNNSEIRRNNKVGNIENFHDVSGTIRTPKKKLKKKTKISKVENRMNSKADEVRQENDSSDSLMRNKKNIKKSTLKKNKNKNLPSNSSNKIEIGEVATRKRKRSDSAKSTVSNENSEKLSHKDRLLSPSIKSPGRKKKKKDKGNEDVPNTSLISVLRKNILKKKKESELSEKQQYLDNKKYLARKSKRLKKKMLKQGG